MVAPGLHWVPRLRKRMVAAYPSLELAFRAMPDGISASESDALDRIGQPLRVTLGDRGQATIGYTVRFRLDSSSPPFGARALRPGGLLECRT